jgi:uncharacterized damage-inducible protein DinB
MTYYGGKELAEGFRTVRKNTILIAEDIPEEKYGHRASPETRSIGEFLAHISLVSGMQELLHTKERRASLEGIDFPAIMREMIAKEKQPRSKAEVIAQLRADGDRFARFLEGATEDLLAERVTFPAGATIASKTRFEMILGVKEHEMHHRGQLMLIERQIGIVPHLTRDMQARMAARAHQAKAFS